MRKLAVLLACAPWCGVSAKEAPKPTAARVVASAKDHAPVKIARVVRIADLVAAPTLRVAVAVVDLGGSTDVSPTQRAYLTLYAKGEMYSTDAAFDLGAIYCLRTAKQRENALYVLNVVGSGPDGMPVDQELEVDAADALLKLTGLKCKDETDCDASDKFAASVSVRVTTIKPKGKDMPSCIGTQ